eukprot:GGOE01020547.1.p1 GENE.GGOE01020547.1~~GGOE01020547.1.p1  ORF type:complete len:221 (-),score=21.67 GGOE01020547.1:393-1055(-)
MQNCFPSFGLFCFLFLASILYNPSTLSLAYSPPTPTTSSQHLVWSTLQPPVPNNHNGGVDGPIRMKVDSRAPLDPLQLTRPNPEITGPAKVLFVVLGIILLPIRIIFSLYHKLFNKAPPTEDPIFDHRITMNAMAAMVEGNIATEAAAHLALQRSKSQPQPQPQGSKYHHRLESTIVKGSLLRSATAKATGNTGQMRVLENRTMVGQRGAEVAIVPDTIQ